jgi:hypothetical protein
MSSFRLNSSEQAIRAMLPIRHAAAESARSPERLPGSHSGTQSRRFAYDVDQRGV